jgi:cation diffusion facilitator CzcD-associated flavoprotein CzcO
MLQRKESRLNVIGCGIAGIALAARLKSQLGYKIFVIYEREKSLGGTWYLNTYPGVGYRLRSIFHLLCARTVDWLILTSMRN